MIEPWTGTRWGDHDNLLGGRRLLILGESHHSEHHPIGSKPADMTQGVVQAYLDDDLHPRSKAFFTKLAGLLSGKPGASLSQAERAAVWNAVAFYNYIPCIAAEGPRNWPYRDEWASDAEFAFAHWRDALKVESVLVCGKRLWVWSGHWGGHAEGGDLRFYPGHAGLPVQAGWINHPSSAGWTAGAWAGPVSRLLNADRAQVAAQ